MAKINNLNLEVRTLNQTLLSVASASVNTGNEQLTLTLQHAALPGGPLNVFFTSELFGQSIMKARELLLFELSHVLMKTGVLQTRDFIAPEFYLEYIDMCIRLVWFGMYREYYLQLGLTDMSAGKFAAIASDVSIPTRVIELCEGILAPVLIGKDVFCPSEKLVRCAFHPEIDDAAIVWGIPVDPVIGLALRYGFPKRNSIVDRIKQFPGAMSQVPDYTTLPIVSRIIRFEELSDEAVEQLVDAPANPAPEVLPQGLPLLLQVPGLVETDEASLTHTRLCARYSTLCNAIYIASENNYADHAWFVPFIYNGLPDGDFGRALASYLPLIWCTRADVDSRNHTATFGQNAVQTPGTYFPLRGNDRRHPRSYVDLSCIADLRRKEGRLSPLEEDEVVNRANLIATIDGCWFNRNFPSIEDPNMFVQITWEISYSHPFLAVRSLTRGTKFGIQGKRPNKPTTVKGNVHGATTGGKIPQVED